MYYVVPYMPPCTSNLHTSVVQPHPHTRTLTAVSESETVRAVRRLNARCTTENASTHLPASGVTDYSSSNSCFNPGLSCSVQITLYAQPSVRGGSSTTAALRTLGLHACRPRVKSRSRRVSRTPKVDARPRLPAPCGGLLRSAAGLRARYARSHPEWSL